MTQIKRYDVEVLHNIAQLVYQDDGMYVLFSDHEGELNKERHEWSEYIKKIKADDEEKGELK